MALIQFDDVTIGYGQKAVLEHVTFPVSAATFTGLLGGNGSGKTTLLKTLLGILPPLAGQITRSRIDGRELTFGYVPQRETLDPLFLFTSLEVALMGCCQRVRPGRFYPAAERQHAQECLDSVGAADLARQRFSELSGGQKQRVLIARALLTRPDVLCLDEPTSGLDPTATENILELLRQLHAEHHLTVVMVSHDLPAVQQSARDVIWIHQGRLHCGPVNELLTNRKIEDILRLQLS